MLGPILFNLYVSPLGQLCKSHGVEYQSYADDTQNYLGFKVNKSAIRDGVNRLENCLLDVKNWMWVNLLKLNDDKTEVIVLGNATTCKTRSTYFKSRRYRSDMHSMCTKFRCQL